MPNGGGIICITVAFSSLSEKMDFCRIVIYVLLLIFRSRVAGFHAMFLRKIQDARERSIMVLRRLQAQFRDIFECRYVCAFDGGQKYLEPREKQHLVG